MTPSNCDVFVQIWVDVNAVTDGEGVYLVDNRVSSNSKGEGGPDLNTSCENGDYICWTLATIDPNANATQLGISDIGNCLAWGATGQPQASGSTGLVYVGQAQETGSESYEIALNVNGTTLRINPGITVN